ncbi:hypothetical protein N665_0250s0018 [Sinapis alba]|nr:hypothetical protein N665_0250s0018 [Sinapis alba]
METKRFSIFCQQVRVKLPPVRKPPSPLKELLDTPRFRQHIRVVNGMLAFKSMGVQIDHTVTGTPGPFTYIIHGQVHHQIGSLLPPEGKAPAYLHLLIFDTHNEVMNRKKAFLGESTAATIDDNTLSDLIRVLDEHNPLAKTFCHSRDRYERSKTEEFSITLKSQRHWGRQYDLPTSDEIAGLIVGDFSLDSLARDVVVEFKSSALQRISDLHPLLKSLQYPILFPYGEPGYHERIPYQSVDGSRIKRECMTMREYYAYQLQTRLKEGMTLIKYGRLLHLYIVDAYTATEQERLRFISLNQKKLHADLYSNICDAIDSGDTDARQVGKRTSKKGVFFSKPAAVVYTIDFQKRGLPHAHIILWFETTRVEATSAMIDKYISAELPNKLTDLEGFQLVQRHMMHGPCGVARPNYTKPLSEYTRIDNSGFVVYMRRDNTSGLIVGSDEQVGNEYVVPHNLEHLRKYKAHINVEWCCKTSTIKYLFKYITKGVDKATIHVGKAGKKRKADGKKEDQPAVSVWRLFSFHIHHNQPSVMKLNIHLPGKQRLLYDQSANLADVLRRPNIDRTMFTAWMVANDTYEEARELTFIEFPSRFTYHSDEIIWTPRQKGTAIGRITYIHPSAGDLYYLRILREFNFKELVLQDDQLQQYTLMELERLLKENEKSQIDFKGIPLPEKKVLDDIANSERSENDNLYVGMNSEQKTIYDAVLESVDNKTRKLFFVYGPGGTGKTYLYRTLISKIQSEKNIVIPVASSGIAALLLPRGRTAHSRFKLPLNLTKADIIIWDEAPMAHRHTFETVDRTLRDLLSVDDDALADKPFGEKTVLLGGDFRQILHVVAQGSREDTICVYKDFPDWILQVGNGTAATVDSLSDKNGEGDRIAIPTKFMIPNSGQPERSLTDAAYPDFTTNYHNIKYLRERAILTPTNDTSHQINYFILSLVPTKTKDGQWNGTRLIITRIGHIIISERIMTGAHIEEEVLIPRIQLSPNESVHPFTFRRHKYSIRLYSSGAKGENGITNIVYREIFRNLYQN